MPDPAILAAAPVQGLIVDGLATVEALAPCGMISLRGDLGDESFAAMVAQGVEIDLPERRAARFNGERGLLWMAPDELLLLCGYAEAPGLSDQLSESFGDTHALAVTVSDARVMFRVRGTQTRDVLAKLAPVDLSADAMPAGIVRRTRLAQVPAAFWFTRDTEARVICFRSVADYVAGLFAAAADPASAVGYHAR